MLLSTINEKTIAKPSMPRAPARRRRLERCRSLPASFAGKARFPFAADFMLLDQRCAGAEDGRKGEKETTDGRSITTADEAGEDRRGTAERERIRYSYQRPSRSDDGEKRIGVMSGLRRGSAGRKRRSARRQREQGSRRRSQPCANEEVADDDAVDGERDRASHHCLALEGCVVWPVPVHRDAQRGEGHRWRGSEQTGEALGTQNVTETAKADTTTPPTRKRTRYSVISLSSRVSAGAAGSVDRIFPRRRHLRDGLERARTVFDSRALVVRTGRRVGADDEEVVVRGQALVPRAGRQDGRVAGLQREDPTFVAAEADAALAARDAQLPHGSGSDSAHSRRCRRARYRPIRLLRTDLRSRPPGRGAHRDRPRPDR
jgi:hypothetical protein